MMASAGKIYPGAKFRPIASHGGAMSAQDGNILHVTTNHFDPYGFFSNSNNGASSTWWIGETVIGKCKCPTPQNIVLCEQYYDALVKCWAQAAGNGLYQSTETSGVPTQAMSAAMIHTLAHLYAWGHLNLGWSLALAEHPGAKGFGWHGMGGQAWGGHIGCPGGLRRNQRAAVLAQAKVILGQKPDTHTYTPTKDTAPRYMGLLVSGSHGTPVHEWQDKMIRRGWVTIPNSGGKKFTADGVFGKDTEAVTRAFEAILVKHRWQFVGPKGHAYSTTVDGKIGVCVWHAAWDAPSLN